MQNLKEKFNIASIGKEILWAGIPVVMAGVASPLGDVIVNHQYSAPELMRDALIGALFGIVVHATKEGLRGLKDQIPSQIAAAFIVGAIGTAGLWAADHNKQTPLLHKKQTPVVSSYTTYSLK